MIASVLVAESILLAAGLALGHPFLGAALCGGLLFLVLAYRRPGIAWMVVWLSSPFSIETRIPGGSALYVPTEPLVALALLAWAARTTTASPIRIPHSRLHAPLSALAAVTLLSVLFSHHLVLGSKAWIVAAGYVAFGYLYCFLNESDVARAERWYPWVVGSGAAWGLYGAARVALEGVSLRSAYGAARPFFPEHGAYAAYLAMILPLALLLALSRRGTERMLYVAATVSMALGIALSLTRAAWVSLAVVIPLTIGLWSWWKRSLKPVLWLAGLALLVFVVLVGAGAGGQITRHLHSITAAEDASNLERVNRWMAAVEMARDRPWLGVGYAAYPLAYPQYRRKTIITELAYQHMGPHSEPMRLLSETGLLGLLAACWFMGAAFLLGFRIFRRSPDPRVKGLSLAIVAGLGTYAIHAVFRTYLDLEKITIPFWAVLGLLAAMGRRLDASALRGKDAAA